MVLICISLTMSDIEHLCMCVGLQYVLFGELSIQKPKTLVQRNICTLTFIAALFTVATLWKQPKCPSIDEWIKMWWYTYTMEYYSAIKRIKSYQL